MLFGDAVFAFRHSCRLAHRSQRKTDDDRATRRADTIRRRVGWEPGILNGEGLKPKGMHWRAFERLLGERLNSPGLSRRRMFRCNEMLATIFIELRPGYSLTATNATFKINELTSTCCRRGPH